MEKVYTSLHLCVLLHSRRRRSARFLRSRLHFEGRFRLRRPGTLPQTPGAVGQVSRTDDLGDESPDEAEDTSKPIRKDFPR